VGSATAIAGEQRQPAVGICEVKGDPTALPRKNDPARRAPHPSRGRHGRSPDLDAASACREDETALDQCEGSLDPARRAVGASREPRCETMLVWFERGWAISGEPLEPAGGRLYAFTNMNADSAKFELKEYKQFFADSSGYFAKVVGSAFAPARYYRFDDGSLKSLKPYSPDLVPSDMIVCGGSSCDGQGVTLQSASRK
jgi:hypothetical protein